MGWKGLGTDLQNTLADLGQVHFVKRLEITLFVLYRVVFCKIK